MKGGYVICGTPRSGSTLLCGLLAATGRMGVPDSFFRRQILSEWAEDWGLPEAATQDRRGIDRAYLAAALRAGTGGTEVFGLRLMQENLAELCTALDRLAPGRPSDRARLEAAFGPLVFVHLSRTDRVAQAVSLVRAQQTGLWHVAPDGSEVERLAPPREPVFDLARLKREVDRLERAEAAWQAWFATEGIAPLDIRYESLARDPEAAVGQLCAALKVDPPAQGSLRPGVARLADGISAEWIARYRAETGGRGSTKL